MKKHADIDAYIQDQPKNVQVRLKKMRAIVKKAAPDALEAISYRIPTFKLNGNLVHFGAFTNHISFFPTASGVAAFQKSLKGYKTARGTIQFPHDEPLPIELITEIVEFRVTEARKKKSGRKTPRA